MLSREGGGHIVNISTSLVDHTDSAVPSASASLTKGGLNAVTKFGGVLGVLGGPSGSEGVRRHRGTGCRRDAGPFTDRVLGPSGPLDNSLILAHEQLAGDRNDW